MSIVVSVSSASNSVSNTIPLTWITKLAIGSEAATILLILLISCKEIISVTDYRDDRIVLFLNAMIWPLLVVFLFIIVFKILEII